MLFIKRERACYTHSMSGNRWRMCPCIDNVDKNERDDDDWKKEMRRYVRGENAWNVIYRPSHHCPHTIHISHKHVRLKEYSKKKVKWGEMSSNIKCFSLCDEDDDDYVERWWWWWWRRWARIRKTEDFLYFCDEMMMSCTHSTNMYISPYRRIRKGHAWMFLMCVLSRDGFLLYAIFQHKYGWIWGDVDGARGVMAVWERTTGK